MAGGVASGSGGGSGGAGALMNCLAPEPVTVPLLRRLSGLPSDGGGDGDDDLSRVARLTIAVDTRDNQPCDEIGHAMPGLVQLQLVNSSLASVRDLVSVIHLCMNQLVGWLVASLVGFHSSKAAVFLKSCITYRPHG